MTNIGTVVNEFMKNKPGLHYTGPQSLTQTILNIQSVFPVSWAPKSKDIPKGT